MKVKAAVLALALGVVLLLPSVTFASLIGDSIFGDLSFGLGLGGNYWDPVKGFVPAGSNPLQPNAIVADPDGSYVEFQYGGLRSTAFTGTWTRTRSTSMSSPIFFRPRPEQLGLFTSPASTAWDHSSATLSCSTTSTRHSHDQRRGPRRHFCLQRRWRPDPRGSRGEDPAAGHSGARHHAPPGRGASRSGVPAQAPLAEDETGRSSRPPSVSGPPRQRAGGPVTLVLSARLPGVAGAGYSTQSTRNRLVSPGSLPPRLLAKTSRLPSGENIGKPSKVGSLVIRSRPLPSSPIM